MRGTLLLLVGLLAFVASKRHGHDQDTRDHDAITHERESHDEDKEGSFDSGSSASGSGQGKTVNALQLPDLKN